MTDLAALSARAPGQGHPRQEGVERRGDQGRHRAPAGLPRADPLHHRAGGRRGAGRRQGRRCRHRQGQRQGAARRRAAGAQGHVRPQGQDRQLGRQDPRRQAGRARTPPRSPASRRPAPCRSRRCTWPSSPTARPGTTTCWATPAIPGTPRASPAAPRPERLRPWPMAPFPPASAPTPAARCALPAACCGVASIKPTWGRISRAGAMPLAPALDTVGVHRPARRGPGADAWASWPAPIRAIPRPRTLPVPDYVARLDDPVKGLRDRHRRDRHRRGAPATCSAWSSRCSASWPSSA